MCKILGLFLTKGESLIKQRNGCSPIKVIHEMGLERCKAVWSLSAIKHK